ncbi:aldo/keto reductase [Gudongella sp. DL1XJH-153]|uniref:aldo/keto reductase n=1 Tax=Gudongella sp. DL1XJH-153 TaxID=3409804 RepID=UPI003BB7D197
MQYREITRDKLNVSLLGLGCMRFPVLEDDNSRIDVDKATLMVRHAFDKGINYFDTAYPYHGGESEAFLGYALEGIRREDYHLATKSPVWLMENHDDFMRYLDEQLVNLKTNYVDFYLFHALNMDSFKKIKSLEFEKFVNQAKKEGKIKHIGFSFHDELPVFKEIIDYYPWEFCQIQLNYMDVDYQAGLSGLEYARNKGIDVVVMEPLKGGKLANSPDDVLQVWNKAKTSRTPVQWALNWLYSLPGISVVLSGMSTMDQLDENIRISSYDNSMSLDDMDIVKEAADIYRSRTKVDCTGCKYCIPCPQNVEIPNIFELYNNAHVYGTMEESINSYSSLVKKESDSSKCIECGLCEEKCPQNLRIIQYLKEAKSDLYR